MTRRLMVAVGAMLLTGALAVTMPLALGSLPAGPDRWSGEASNPERVTAILRPEHVATRLGGTFTVDARIVNAGPAGTGPLLAHLNVVSLDESVYVDPEDWSSSRTRQLGTLDAGASTAVSWSVQAVNAGHFVVYVVVVPDVKQTAKADRLVVSTPTHVVVTARRTLNPGGSLAVAVLVPLLVGTLALAARRRRRVRG